MLYNPKWSTTPSLDGFIAWLREQDPNKRFVVTDSLNCALGQYYRSLKRAPIIFIDDIEGEFGLEPASLYRILSEPCTFGAALARALAYRASL